MTWSCALVNTWVVDSFLRGWSDALVLSCGLEPETGLQPYFLEAGLALGSSLRSLEASLA